MGQGCEGLATRGLAYHPGTDYRSRGRTDTIHRAREYLIHTLVILAAGLSRRYGRPKPIDPVGPHGEILIDYGIHDAVRAGFRRVVIVTRPELRPPLEEHLVGIWSDALTIEFTHQDIEDLPAGSALRPNRRRPWGTGHAVLAVRMLVSEPFAVINCDDYYGRDAYINAALHLSRQTTSHAVTGYRLDETLSESGGVSRAECVIGPDGSLVRLTEYLNVRRDDHTIVGESPDGYHRIFAGSEIVSMNFWAFQPTIFTQLEEIFLEFLNASDDDPHTEFFLSIAVNHLVTARLASVTVLPSSDRWFGMTYSADRSSVVAALAQLTDDGVYPNNIASFAAGT